MNRTSENQDSRETTKRWHAMLYVNDAPDEYVGNGEFVEGPHPHGHVYFAEVSRPVVQVTFVAHNGTATRVSFDPATGEATTQDITEAQRP